ETHLVPPPSRAYSLALLRTPAHHERVPSFQAHHDTAASRCLDQQDVDLLLRQRMAFPSRPLADKDPLRPWRRLLQQIRMHQPIVYHDLGRPQSLEPAPRDQARIPRSRTDDVDDPCATG